MTTAAPSVLRRPRELSGRQLGGEGGNRIVRIGIPRYIRFVDAFPMTITGKIQKFVMSDAMKRKLGLLEGRTA